MSNEDVSAIRDIGWEPVWDSWRSGVVREFDEMNLGAGRRNFGAQPHCKVFEILARLIAAYIRSRANMARPP